MRAYPAGRGPHILNRMPIYDHLARRYHENLPGKIRAYLKLERGLSDAVIEKYQLGWDGQRITIPIANRSGHVAFFKLAKAPEDTSGGPKMLASFGGHAELYGWDRVQESPERIVIAEGEFDRLALESRGFAAVTSTAGALTFRREWADALRFIGEVYICFDRDAAGVAGARRVASFLSGAKIVRLPDEVGHAGDVTDFFVRLGRTEDDFRRLLDEARSCAEAEQAEALIASGQRHAPFVPSDIAQLKASVRIEDWAGFYLTLVVQGQNYVARCPFHDDRTPSFVVFPATRTFHCFGCRAHGDVFTFLMRMRGIPFGDAVEAVRRAQHASDGEGAAA